MKNRFVDRYISKPDKFLLPRVKEVHNKKVYRGKKSKKIYTKEELLEYAKEKGFKSVKELRAIERVSRKNPEPTYYNYLEVFGSWKKFLKEAYPEEQLTNLHQIEYERPPSNIEYIIKVMVTYNLYKYPEYLKAHRKRPDIVPSIRHIRNRFKRGYWRKAVMMAKASDLKYVLKLYLELKKELGRWPNRVECVKYKIDIPALESLYGSKESMEDLLEYGLKTCEQKKK